MPGIIVQTMAFGGFVTALGLAEDLQQGPDRPLPLAAMARSAVLAGPHARRRGHEHRVDRRDDRRRACSSASTSATSPLEVLAGLGLLLLFGYAFSWVFALHRADSRARRRARSALGFIVIFPLTFASSAFVPPDSMPAALEAFAEREPVHAPIVDAMRALFVAPGGQRRVGRGRLVRRPDRSCFAALSVHRVQARGQLLRTTPADKREESRLGFWYFPRWNRYPRRRARQGQAGLAATTRRSSRTSRGTSSRSSSASSTTSTTRPRSSSAATRPRTSSSASGSSRASTASARPTSR